MLAFLYKLSKPTKFYANQRLPCIIILNARDIIMCCALKAMNHPANSGGLQ